MQSTVSHARQLVADLHAAKKHVAVGVTPASCLSTECCQQIAGHDGVLHVWATAVVMWGGLMCY